MLNVVCVEWGNYLSRGSEYVLKLRSMVERNLSAPHRFVCMTEAPDRHPGVECVALAMGLTGWWNKIEAFKPGLFDGEVLYLDLDSVVTGPLEPLAAAKGILHLDRWGWDRKVYGSGVMRWRAGEHSDIWSSFTPDVPRKFEGDQNWITSLGGWPALPDGLCVSYRYHCKKGPPPGASVIAMHGLPKPHEISAEWVKQAWR